MNICLDSCFLFALYDNREIERHPVAVSIFESYLDTRFSSNKLVILWPILYESVNTRFVKHCMDEFYRHLRFMERRDIVEYIDDRPYRDSCLRNVFSLSNRRRELSLVDLVIREALMDHDLKIDAIITFDPGDFHEICNKRGIRLLCQET